MTLDKDEITKREQLFFAKAHSSEGDKRIRKIMPDEIVLEYDGVTREQGEELVFKTLEKLQREGNYKIEVWSHGGKSPHIHIKNIQGLSELESDHKKRYRMAFANKYAADPSKIDTSLFSDKHLIAAEDQPHYKIETHERPYGIKRLVMPIIHPYAQNKIEKELKASTLIKAVKTNGKPTKSFIKAANELGFNIGLGNKIICPFHNDTNPSLQIYEDEGRYYCYGCKAIGDIDEFVKRVKIIKGIWSVNDDIISAFEGEKHSEGIYLLAQKFLTEEHFVTLNGSIYIYKDGVYIPKAEEIIQSDAQEILGKIGTIKIMNELLAHIKRATYRKVMIEDPNLICFNNGLYDIKENILKPHNPEILFFSKSPIDYNPDVDCTNIKKFLEEVVHDDDITAIYEFIGYCLYKRYNFHKSVMLVGEGSNGKSTFISILLKFLGQENTTSIPLQTFETNRFSVSQLFGKLANIFADLPSTDLKRTAIFKMLTGEDLITAEKKYQEGFSFINYAKLIFSCNRVPRVIEDLSDAFFRRWLIIVFPNQFIGTKADKRLKEKLTTPIELSGLLNRALEGLNRLLTNGDFTTLKDLERTKDFYMRQSDSVWAFAEDRIEQVMDSYEELNKLFSEYLEHCRINKLPPLSDKGFFMRLPQIKNVTDYRPIVDKKQIRCWKGIKLNPILQTINSKTIDSSSNINYNNQENIVEKASIASIFPFPSDIGKEKSSKERESDIYKERKNGGYGGYGDLEVFNGKSSKNLLRYIKTHPENNKGEIERLFMENLIKHQLKYGIIFEPISGTFKIAKEYEDFEDLKEML